MKELSKLEKIFSITNNPGHKIIRFLGVPITIDSRKIFNTKYGLLPIDNNKIVFCNFKGGGFGCNSKYIAENNEELRQNIKDFDINSYQRKVQQFLNDKGCIEKGNASENVVSLIEKIMK